MMKYKKEKKRKINYLIDKCLNKSAGLTANPIQ